MDKIAVILKLFAGYPNMTATIATQAVYLEVLAEVPTDELHTVVMQCLREGGAFPPSAGQVLQRWLSAYSAPVQGAERGWLSVQMAMRDPCNYVPEPSAFVPRFKDPLVGKVVAAMGWYNLRMSEQPRVDQAQFIKMYDAFAAREAGELKLSDEFKALRDRKQLEQHDTEDKPNGIVKRISG